MLAETVHLIYPLMQDFAVPLQIYIIVPTHFLRMLFCSFSIVFLSAVIFHHSF